MLLSGEINSQVCRLPLVVERVVAIPSDAYPTRAARPRNSRLDLTRMRGLLGGSLPGWREMLDLELPVLQPLTIVHASCAVLCS